MDAGPNSTVELNGRKIDISKVLPLRMREYRLLLRRGVNVEKAIQGGGNTEDLFQLMLVILQGADSAVTETELDDLLPETFLGLWTRLVEINTALKGAEIPFARTSTSSDVPSTGAPTT